MRIFALTAFVLLAFIVVVPSTYAAICPPDATLDTPSGKYFSSGLECQMSSESAGTSKVQSVQPSGTVIVNPNTGTGSYGPNITLANPLKGGGNVQTFLLSILDFVIKLGTIVVILMMVLVGYKFVAAQGEPGKITEARDMLLWTIVGALILLGSKAIALGIEKTVQALSTG